MIVKRRNTERAHSFADEVAQCCGLHDLQGLLLNEHWEPTAAIEAYELSEALGNRRLTDLVIPADELYIKCVFAERVGVPLYLLTCIQGQRGVVIYEFQADHNLKVPRCVSAKGKSETDFVAWWRERKQTVQTKPYRRDLSGRIADSYFDSVLEAQDEKWGGNIDGYLVDWSSGDVDIRGIVENRFTRKTPLNSYDPQRYFSCGGGDYYTWLPLFNLHEQMGVPLFLATYSTQSGETHSAGLTIVESLNQNGIIYMCNRAGQQIYPYWNIMSDAGAIGRWFQSNT